MDSNSVSSITFGGEALLLQALQNLREYDLTITALIPLFKSFGYARVDYNGGPTEEGKDIVCWRDDELGDVELAVVQVKKYEMTRKAGDKHSFSEIVTQLSQCVEKSLPYVDGQRYKPSLVYLVSPFPLESRVLQSRFEGLSALRQQKVKIIDGPRLATLLRARLPQTAAMLCGDTATLRSAIATQLTNRDLLSAFDLRITRSVESFYTDIDFCLGRETTRLFLLSPFEPKKISELVPLELWQTLKEIRPLMQKEFQVDILCTPEADVENEASQYRHELDSWRAELAIVQRKIAHYERSLEEFTKLYQTQLKELARSRPDLLLLHEEAEIFSFELRTLQRKESLFDPTATQVRIADVVAQLNVIHEKLRKEDATAWPTKAEQARLSSEISSLRAVENKLHAEQPEFTVSLSLDGKSLTTALNKKRKWIEDRIAELNGEAPSGLSELRSLLLECKRLFDITSVLLSHPLIARAVGLRPDVQYRAEESKSRLKLSIHTIFDAGLNIIVLGEAGAGKTTSLQMYASGNLSKGDQRFLIYAPLGRLVRVWAQRRPTIEGSSLPLQLEEGLAFFLSSISFEMSSDELSRELLTRQAVLLLDGIDEAIKMAPWILTSITRLAEKYPAIQIITSSRIAGRYVEEIPFLPISLLPFTSEQRSRFVKKWFHEDAKHVEVIQNHLAQNSALAEVVKTPLLATVLCILEENSVPLPASEISLYDERMRLLIGDYDIHKQAARLSSRRNHLNLIARKTAFHLHAAGKRDEDREGLYALAEVIFKDEISKDRARMTIDELVDPCSVLVPMTEDGKLGFGHLVYQEFLAAKELRVNRSISLTPLLSQTWWQGPLVLYARMCDNLEWLVQEFVRNLWWSGARSTQSLSDLVAQVLKAMISARPSPEAQRLKVLLREMIEW